VPAHKRAKCNTATIGNKKFILSKQHQPGGGHFQFGIEQHCVVGTGSYAPWSSPAKPCRISAIFLVLICRKTHCITRKRPFFCLIPQLSVNFDSYYTIPDKRVRTFKRECYSIRLLSASSSIKDNTITRWIVFCLNIRKIADLLQFTMGFFPCPKHKEEQDESANLDWCWPSFYQTPLECETSGQSMPRVSTAHNPNNRNLFQHYRH